MINKKGLSKVSAIIAVVILVLIVAAGVLFSTKPELFQGMIFSRSSKNLATTSKNSDVSKTSRCATGDVDLSLEVANIGMEKLTVRDSKNYYNVTLGVKNNGSDITSPTKLSFLNVKDYTKFLESGDIGTNYDLIFTTPEPVAIKAGESKVFTASLTSMDKSIVDPWGMYAFVVSNGNSKTFTDCNYLNNINKKKTVNGNVSPITWLINRSSLWAPYLSEAHYPNPFSGKFVAYSSVVTEYTNPVLMVYTKNLDAKTVDNYFQSFSNSYDLNDSTKSRQVSISKNEVLPSDISLYDTLNWKAYNSSPSTFPSEWEPGIRYTTFDIPDVDALYNASEGKTFVIEYRLQNPSAKSGYTVTSYSKLLYIRPYIVGTPVSESANGLSKLKTPPFLKR